MTDIVEVFFDVISVHLCAWSNIFGRQRIAGSVCQIVVCSRPETAAHKIPEIP